jgi:uncharacterized protein (TIGR02145 family)
MQTKLFIFSIIFITFLKTNSQTFSYSFSTDQEGWTHGFSDYPIGEEDFYELDFYWSPLPQPLNTDENSLYITGNNHSDDLFMFIKKQITGLSPNTTYQITIEVEFASIYMTNGMGVGGAPGEGVTMKAGATLYEPDTINGFDYLGYDGWIMNLDKCNQTCPGPDMDTIGHVGVADTTTVYTLKTNNNISHPFTITTDDNGTVWIIIGTDSGFEATTSLYYNQINIVFTSLPDCGSPLTDERDGQTYQTILIGEQCWMAENLNYGTMINSSAPGQLQTDNGIIEKYCYNNNSSNCNTYGGLYEWDEMMQYHPADDGDEGSIQGICPEGWHLPTHNEWKTLEITLGMTQEDADAYGQRGTNEGCKLAGNESLWYNGTLDANAEFGTSGFSALPAGERPDIDGLYYDLSFYAYFWTTTEYNTDNYLARRLGFYDTEVYLHYYPRAYGMSVRCVKDNIATSSIINKQSTSSDLVIYPNPATDVIRVKGDNIEYIEIQNLQGKSIFHTYSCDEFIDVSMLPKGLYLIKTQNKIGKFIVN